MTVAENYQKIIEQIRDLKIVPESLQNIKILAVTKKQSAININKYLAMPLLQHFIGENYVQEFAAKKADLIGSYESHLIGRLQSNKVVQAVSLFDVIQSVDSLKLAEKINKAAIKINKIQRIYLQINISDDENKSGVDLAIVEDLVAKVLELKYLKLEGLMTITKNYENTIDVKADFLKMQVIAREIKSKFLLESLELSMGMTQDFEIAVQAGSSMIRIGTALFGSRI